MARDDFPKPETVVGRLAPAEFVERLRIDLEARPEDRENPTLDRLLEALSAYPRDVPGDLRNVASPTDPERPSWE